MLSGPLDLKALIDSSFYILHVVLPSGRLSSGEKVWKLCYIKRRYVIIH